MWEDPRGGPCECAQDQTRAGLAGREEVLPILQDLIAELRTTPRSPSARPPLWVRLSVAHAEARLREVQGDSPQLPTLRHFVRCVVLRRAQEQVRGVAT